MTDIEIKALNSLNRHFYQSVAEPFSDSREHFWPGWQELLPFITARAEQEKIFTALDVGCGNGRFGLFLNQALPKNTLEYLGVDMTKELLDIAEKKLEDISVLKLRQLDIIDAVLLEESQYAEKLIGTAKTQFDCITCFGVFHHIPSKKLRVKLLKLLTELLKPEGTLYCSFWQFDRAERLLQKTVPEHEFALEENDYILSWDRSIHALRYCHLTNLEEQNELIALSGAKLVKRFDADGREGNLNTYLVLQRS